jgi:alkanesulfonate monooxygenase SsuD/methylene tetrahydromethanopterin reductase-like flavin-dependent oxidoreductase (luciferase family)
VRFGLALPHYGFSFPRPPSDAKTSPDAENNSKGDYRVHREAGESSSDSRSLKPAQGKALDKSDKTVGEALEQPDRGQPNLPPWRDLLGVAKWAEERGFASLWVSDHIALDLSKYGGDPSPYPSYELATVLGALASSTRKAELGALVACTFLRPAAVIASMASSVAAISGRPFWLGLGAGWYQLDFEAVGQPMPDARTRIANLRQTVLAIRELYTRHRFSVPLMPPETSSETAELDPSMTAASCSSALPLTRSPSVHLLVGGKGGRRILEVASLAGAWNIAWQVAPEELARKVALLESLMRNTQEGSRSKPWVSVGLTCLTAPDLRRLRKRFADMFDAFSLKMPKDFNETYQEARNTRLVATHTELSARVELYRDAGADEIICCFGPVPFSFWDRSIADEFVEVLDLTLRCTP